MTRASGPRRVLLVDAGRGWRGGQRQLLLLATGLRARGWEPLVVGPPGTPLLQAMKRAGIATASRGVRTPVDLTAFRGLRRLISTWRPDILHAHDRRSHAVSLAALVGRSQRIPLVVTRRIATAPAGPFRRGPGVDRFIAITRAVHDGLRAAGVEEQRIALVYPGVATPEAPTGRDWRAECGWPAGTIVAGVVGPASESRHRDEIEALLKQLSAATRDALGLVLLGGPAAGRTELAGVRAYRAGFVHEVPSALAGLDLILHPGRGEGLGTAVVEGMALRVPTLGFATGGIGEIIDPGRNGLLVPPGDTPGFAAALQRLVTDRAVRQALGDAGPARAAEFSADRMVDQTAGVYRDLLERPAV